jgi:hypothetical protein
LNLTKNTKLMLFCNFEKAQWNGPRPDHRIKSTTLTSAIRFAAGRAKPAPGKYKHQHASCVITANFQGKHGIFQSIFGFKHSWPSAEAHQTQAWAGLLNGAI